MTTSRFLLGLSLGLAAGLLCGILIGRSAVAASPTASKPVASWRPVAVPSEASLQGRAVQEAESTAGASLPAQVTDAPRVTPPTNAPEANVPSRSISGIGSWYCSPPRSPCTRGVPASTLAAAAGPALRVGAWRGRVVTVEANGRSVRVRLVDWCACPGRLVDLYAAAFARLAPLSRGVVTVTVPW